MAVSNDINEVTMADLTLLRLFVNDFYFVKTKQKSDTYS